MTKKNRCAFVGLLAVCLSLSVLVTGDIWADHCAQKLKFAARSIMDSFPATGSEGTIYVRSDVRYVYAIEQDWTQRWEPEIGDDPFSFSTIGPDGTIYVVSNDGTLYAIKLPGSGMQELDKAVSKGGGKELQPQKDIKKPSQGSGYIISSSPHLQETVNETSREIREIRFEIRPEGEEKVIILLNGPYLPKTSGIEGDRPRMVCDFFGARIGSGIGDRMKVKGELVQQIRTGSHGGPKPKARVVVDLVPQRDYDVEPRFFRDRNLYVLIFKPR